MQKMHCFFFLTTQDFRHIKRVHFDVSEQIQTHNSATTYSVEGTMEDQS